MRLTQSRTPRLLSSARRSCRRRLCARDPRRVLATSRAPPLSFPARRSRRRRLCARRPRSIARRRFRSPRADRADAASTLAILARPRNIARAATFFPRVQPRLPLRKFCTSSLNIPANRICVVSLNIHVNDHVINSNGGFKEMVFTKMHLDSLQPISKQRCELIIS